MKKFILIIKAIVNYFKPFLLLLVGKKRILDVRKTSDSVILLQRLLDKGVVKKSVLSKKLAFQAEKDMKKQVKKARKKGEKITMKDLVKPIKADPSFIDFCAKIDLPLSFFEGLAENIIKGK